MAEWQPNEGQLRFRYIAIGRWKDLTEEEIEADLAAPPDQFDQAEED